MQNTLKYQDNYITKQLVLPLNLEFILLKDSEVYTYFKLMKGININKYFGKIFNTGRTPKNRTKIMNVILFGYIIGVRSARKIEEACKNDIRFMYLIEDTLPPSHTF